MGNRMPFKDIQDLRYIAVICLEEWFTNDSPYITQNDIIFGLFLVHVRLFYDVCNPVHPDSMGFVYVRLMT